MYRGLIRYGLKSRKAHRCRSSCVNLAVGCAQRASITRLPDFKVVDVLEVFKIAMSFKGELAAYEGSHENKPVTLPVFQFKEFDREAVAKKARIGTRTIKAGLAAWEAIGDANRFENWKRIGAALAIGKTYTLRVTGANAAWGKTYRSVFGQWMKNRGFGSMRPSERSYAIAFI